jgi:hypothetical protein
MGDEIKALLTELIEKVTDTDLLDLIYKLLLESTQDLPL